MILLAQISFVLAAVPAVLLLANLLFYRRLRAGSSQTPISVLIPARNEEKNIAAVIGSVLANATGSFEVVVLDDDSTDHTRAVVEALAVEDPRVRLERAPPLPAGWAGKQHACWVLSSLARYEMLLFVDADVRLAPDAIGRLALLMDDRSLGLASGVPRQITATISEKLAVPIVHFLLLGYLPMFAARFTNHPAFAAGCGQLMLVRSEAYRRAGGHAAIRGSLHDGIKLPRAFRAHGIRTDLFDATDIATCRMYSGAADVWNGFLKNATEGMATPVALPVWTLLLFGGQVLPFILFAGAFLGALEPEIVAPAGAAVATVLATRLVLAMRFRQSILGVVLHPAGVLMTLAIQLHGLVRERRGGPKAWRGRQYPVG